MKRGVVKTKLRNPAAGMVKPDLKTASSMHMKIRIDPAEAQMVFFHCNRAPAV